MISKPPILDETGVKIKQAIIRVKNKFLGQDDSAVTPGSAASSGTAAVMQDDTGRDIITALNDLGDAVKPASATDSGLVTTGTQTFAGDKTFSGNLTVGGDITGRIGGATHQTTLINSGSSKTFTVPNGSRHLIIVSGTVTARMAAYIVGCATNGTVGTGELLTGTSITMTTAANAITIAASGGSASILIITFSGSPITFS